MNETYKIITETKDEVDFDKFSNFVPKIISDEQDELEEKLIDDFDFTKKPSINKITKKEKKYIVLQGKWLKIQELKEDLK